jgi:hypothetical protein
MHIPQYVMMVGYKIIYNKRAIFDDNLLDNIRLFQKANIRHFIFIMSGKRPRFTINQIVWCSSSHSKYTKLQIDRIG